MAIKKILVTGSSGLVGSAFKKIQNEFNYTFVFITSNDCNLEVYSETKACFQKHKPDYIIHLAACVGGLYKNMNYKVDMLEKNLLMNFNVVKCSYEIGVEKLICMLSTCIFPDSTTYPINENMLHDGPPHFSNDAYSYAKRMMEVHCKAYNENYNTNYSCIIPTNIYGSNDNFSLEDGHVLPSLVHKCYLANRENINFEIRGTGIPLRQFIYYGDLARIIVNCIEKLNRESLIISPDEEYSIKYIAEEISKAFEYNKDIVFNTSYSDGQFKKTADNSKLKRLLPEIKFTSIQEGIRETVEFFKNNYITCRK